MEYDLRLFFTISRPSMLRAIDSYDLRMPSQGSQMGVLTHTWQEDMNTEHTFLRLFLNISRHTHPAGGHEHGLRLPRVLQFLLHELRAPHDPRRRR